MPNGVADILHALATRLASEATVETYRFGDLTVRTHIRSIERAAELPRMVAHRRATPGAVCTAEIFVVEGACEELAPLLPPAERRADRLVEATGELYWYWSPERGGNLTLVDRRRRRALLWYTAAGEIPAWAFCRPFLDPLYALLLPTRFTPVHGAAVALGDAAILIAGRGGVGKTTTALVCAEAGWDYLADDFVLIGGPPWRAESLYRSARIREDMFARLPKSMAAMTTVSDDDGETRAAVDVAAIGHVKSDAVDIRAIVLPQRRGGVGARLTRARRSSALSALAGSSLILLAGGQKETFAKLADLVAQVPCYDFEPGPRLEDIPVALASLISAS